VFSGSKEKNPSLLLVGREGSDSFQMISMDDSQLGLEANPEIMSLLQIVEQGERWQLLPINRELVRHPASSICFFDNVNLCIRKSTV
jgi:hypothetical protein